MTEVIIPSLLSGSSSAFTECAINAILGFFKKKSDVKKRTINQAEIHRYVDEYLNKQYPNLVDYRYINDKLYEFILDYMNYMQPKVNVHGDIIINLFVSEKGIKDSVFGFLNLPESEKWERIKLLTDADTTIPMFSDTLEDSIKSLISRANKVGLQLDVSNCCDIKKIQELNYIVERYEAIYKRKEF